MIRACSIALLVFGLRLSASGQASNHPAQLAPGGRSHHSWTNAALEEVQVAADQGQAEAAFELFTRYNHGTQRINDDPQVIRWLAQAAEGGHPYAQCLFGWYNEHVIGGSRMYSDWYSNNMPAAVFWFRKSAEQNYSPGQYNLAICYLDGKGVEADQERGLELMRQGADQTNALALYKLSELYARGIGEPRSKDDRPFELLLRAATWGGRKEAFAALSFRFQHGLGTERDLVRAAVWYCRASRTDPRMFPLAAKIVDYTSEKARLADPFPLMLSRYVHAAELEPDALEQIGDCYNSGHDVPKHAGRAWVWYSLAARHGASSTQTKLAQAERTATPEQLTEAKGLLVTMTEELSRVASTVHEQESATMARPKR